MNIQDNTILITGGGTGIGLGLARALAGLKNQVVICGRRKHILEDAQKGAPAINTFSCDIRCDEARQRLLAHIRTEFPRLNILINNAAVMRERDFTEEKSGLDEIEEEIAINLTAQLKLTAEVVPLLKGKQDAAIVNVTSAIARVHHEPSPVYCASKAGLSMATKILRYQLKKESIRVFEVIPPPVNTEMCRGARHKLSIDALVAETIQGLRRDRYEIRAGRTKLYYWLDGISPWLAKKAIGRI